MKKTYFPIKAILYRSLQSLITGAIIGTITGLFLRLLTYVIEFSRFLYTSQDVTMKLILALSIIALSILNYIFIKIRPSINGSGIPLIERSIRLKQPIPYLLDVPLIILNTAFAFFVGFPLGSEGPSVSIGAKIAQGTNDLFKTDDVDNLGIGSGTGFGCTFFSPLSGVIYTFEESLHRFNIKLFYRALIASFAACGMIYLIHPHRFFSIGNVDFLTSSQIILILFVFATALLAAFVFSTLIVILTDFFTKYRDNFFVKLRSFLYFAIILMIGLYYYSYIGSGQSIIDTIIDQESFLFVASLLFFRIVITSLFGSGSVSGGLVIPTMAIGALIGQLANIIGHQYFGVSFNQYGFLVLLSMCMMFAFVNKCPLTSICLFCSYMFTSKGDLFIFHSSTIWGIVFILMGFLVAKIFNRKDLYHELNSIYDKYEGNRRGAFISIPTNIF